MGGLPADVDVTVASIAGRADTVLVEFAGGPDDLLVVGGNTGRRWPGWLVRRCVRHARCPVTVVPPPEIARAGDPAALTRRLLREAEEYSGC
jgi:nucleotide-binding universal stress UspA family protein